MKQSENDHRVEENKERYIIARLNDRILPEDREAFYEAPLNDYLQKQKIGEVTGGGTLMNAQKEINYVEIEIELKQGTDISEAGWSIIDRLEQLGAPKGSILILKKENKRIDFGIKEGMAVYLDQSSNSDILQYNIDDVISRISDLIKARAENQRFMELKNKKTALYFYNDSFEEMRNSIAEYIDTYPLRKYIEVVQIA